MEWVSKIQLGLDLRPEERRQYEDLLRKHIHLLLSTTRTLGKSPWSDTKLNYYQMPNRLGPSKGGGIQNTLQW